MYHFPLVGYKTSKDRYAFSRMEEIKKADLSWEQLIKEECSKYVIQKEIKTLGITLKIEVLTTKEGSFLTYRLVTSEPATGDLKLHPFACLLQSEDEEIDSVQETVADNDLARELFNWIAKEDKELEGKGGSTGPQEYRAKLIHLLSLLWD